MRKLSLLALAAFVSSAAFAQDAPAVKRTFRAYMDVISGHMVAQEATNTSSGNTTTIRDQQNLWQGNEYEIGLVYGQNWAKVPWLTTTFAVKFGINPTWANHPDGSTMGRAENQGISVDNKGNARGLWIRGQFGIDFTKYFSFSIDSRLLTALTLQYSWSSGAHGIMVQTGIEFFAGNYSVGGDTYKAFRDSGETGAIERSQQGVALTAAGPIIDAFWVDLVWNASMPMGFANSLLIRPIAFSGDNPTEILEGFHIRLQETLSWSNAGFSVYARVRYNIKNIAYPTYTFPGTDNKWKRGIVHDLSLRAGVSYAYDFSRL